MFELQPYFIGFAVMAAGAFLLWLVSLVKHDVSIVDSLWSLMFLAGAVVYASMTAEPGPRTTLVLILVAVWALRLFGYITWRNWGEEEDRRYQAIRERNEPNFAVKSLYLIFLLQATLAWIISLPLLAAIAGLGPLGALDYLGVTLFAVGLLFETVGDFQLARF